MALATTLSSSALDEIEKKKKERAAKKQGGEAKKAGTSSAKGGFGSAVGGAISTAFGGPVGGALIGAGASAIDANRADKATDPNRPKRRRLAKAQENVKENKRTQERALATLSQAVADWASSIR